MGCGCSGGTVVSQPFSASRVRELSQNINCDYTQEVLQDYKTLLKCIRDKNIFDIFNISHVTVNSYMGIVQSAINYKTYPCYFAAKLDKVKILIEQIQNSNQC